MPRIRTIKPEFFDSPGTAACSPWARLLYIAMWCAADDWGVGSANLKELAAFAFPNDDQWTSKELPCLCKEVANNFGTLFYTHRGRRYYEIPTWDQHQVTQRKAKRKFPPHDDPESVPDKALCSNQGTSLSTQGTSLSTQGKHGYGTGEQGNRGTGEPTGNSRSRAASTALAVADGKPDDRTPTQTLIAEWLEHTDPRPPGRVVGHLSKEIKTLLDEGQPFGDVRNGLALWARKGLHPASLASCVHESRTPKQPHIGGVDWEAAAARAAERDRNAS